MLVDSHRRRFGYLRLSITDRCNFKCVYCLPAGYQKTEVAPELTVLEIERLVRAFAGLGIFKVRITGGEPTVRRDLVEIAQTVAQVPGIRTVALSTNGSRLQELGPDLRRAGVSAVNLSLDSLDANRFQTITGTERFEEVLASVESALNQGFSSVKINVVLLRSYFDLPSFLEFIRTRPVSVRFIELMETAENSTWFASEYLSAYEVEKQLQGVGFVRQIRGEGDGPAQGFCHSNYRGTIGLIAPYAKDFCSTCNRLRVTARGDLRLCLFGNGKTPLRDLLASDEQIAALQTRIVDALSFKPDAHRLGERNYGDTPNFSVYGG